MSFGCQISKHLQGHCATLDLLALAADNLGSPLSQLFDALFVAETLNSELMELTVACTLSGISCM